ncbi:MAG TPA: hypothetical protein VFQ54_09440, partial [Thermomicrobiales bacterium]|nr:hypothetical protein [Thermomicrobiales bacterium]
MENIVVVTFDSPSKAYQGLSILKDLDQSLRISLQSAVVVERQASGQPIVRDGVNDYGWSG